MKFLADPVVEALVLDLMTWLATGERTYDEVMEAWRTSCLRLPVWEEANDRGLLTREDINGRVVIGVSAKGRELLETRPDKG